MSNFAKANKKIENAVVNGYKAVEKGAVDGYKAIENGVVGGYKAVEKGFVDAFTPATKDAEGTPEANAEPNFPGQKTAVAGYQAIEDGVVGGYKKIEDGVVSAYKKVEAKFVNAFLTPNKPASEESDDRKN